MDAKPLTKAERAAVADLLATATARPWRQGKASDAVVSDDASGRPRDDEQALAYYGGGLVAESILGRDRALIAQAPELLERYEATVRQLERALAELGLAS